jgi:hypothetical protein
MPKNGLKFKSDENLDQNVLACGRLADARKWFEYRGWKALPKNDRLQPILKWGADHAYLACPTNPSRSVHRWCRKWAPWLTAAELGQIIAYTNTSNKRWAHDQCAAVLDITVRDRQKLGLRFIGANDDPDYEVRLGIKRAKAAGRSRKYRATRSTGKRGRPKSEGPKPWEVAGLSRRTFYRRKARSTENGTKNASRDIIIDRKRDGISVPHEGRQVAQAYRPQLRPTAYALVSLSKGKSQKIPTKKEARKESKTVGGHPARSGRQTKDSIGPVSDILPDNQSLAWLPIKPDGLICEADSLDELPIGNRESTDQLLRWARHDSARHRSHSTGTTRPWSACYDEQLPRPLRPGSIIELHAGRARV